MSGFQLIPTSTPSTSLSFTASTHPLRLQPINPRSLRLVRSRHLTHFRSMDRSESFSAASTIPLDHSRCYPVPGLQEFAAAVMQRRRAIPSPTFKDPLLHMFDEFDADNDGILSANEIASALRSYGVDVHTDQVQQYISMFEESKALTISRNKFPEFVYSMSIADLNHLHRHPDLINCTSLDSCDLW
eukprot:gene16931-23201_t